MNQQIGLFLFSNDLRLDDNPALALAASEVDQLICLYCLDPKQPPSSLRATSNLSAHRQQFLFTSIKRPSESQIFSNSLMLQGRVPQI